MPAAPRGGANGWWVPGGRWKRHHAGRRLPAERGRGAAAQGKGAGPGPGRGQPAASLGAQARGR
eukprot:12993630-Alexandrium_andersonii.AAC.1